MYQFSLEYFNRIFKIVLTTTEASSDAQIRVDRLLQSLTKTIYVNISRALFNQHKNIFSFMIACRITGIPKLEYDYFNKGSFALPKEKDAKEQLKQIPGLHSDSNSAIWSLKKVFQNQIADLFLKDKEKLNLFHENPFKFTNHHSFTKEHEKITPFQELLLIKTLKPELTVDAISNFIKNTLG